MSALVLFFRQAQRELLIHVRQLKMMLNVALFFVMLMVFFPLSMPPEAHLMRAVAPGLVWMALLLSLLLSADRIFLADYEHGVIEQWLVSGESLTLLVGAKVMVHWLINVLPVLLLCPLIALLFSLTPWETLILVLSVIFGTPAILFLCALAAVFAVGSNLRGALMALVLLPLTVPVMIFGAATLNLAMQGLEVSGYLALLAAFSILAAGFLPFAIAAVIRISLVE